MDDAQAEWTLTTFFFGLHVAETVNDVGYGNTPVKEMLDLLLGIANGKQTLLPSGAEFRQEAEAKGHVTHGLDIERILKDNQKDQQQVARIILGKISQIRGTGE